MKLSRHWRRRAPTLFLARTSSSWPQGMPSFWFVQARSSFLPYDFFLLILGIFFLYCMQTGGPSWEVFLGRRDSLTASLEDSNDIMPSPRANATALIQLFKRFGLSVKDMVALSGSHTIGKARCFSIVHRLYNQSGTGEADPTIELRYKKYLDKLCPQSGDGNVTGNLDATPTVFDNQYFKDLVKGRGFLNSDEVLFSTGGETRQLVELFSKNQTAFFSSFTTSMINLGNLFSSHSLHCGEIRRDCRRVNSRTAAPPELLMPDVD
uniref:Plant heme peroxidase family profile domain-containing protein n=1 Tax=Picea sitchensis TaxID=3332 RepID=D5A9Z0_PICSI|nr:unknown [Picea sitchensis]